MAARRILINPVTRIEGHAKISIHLDDEGQVVDARFQVTEFRGFETFCQGRLVWEMPALCARVCGICPISHLLASSKAGDAILGVRIPRAAVKLRRLANLAQIVQSHALSFFHLSSPDLLLGFDAPPEQRNIFALASSHPDMARAGIRLRGYGQSILAQLTGKRIHPSWAGPGGVRWPLTPAARSELSSGIDEQIGATRRAIDVYRTALGRFEAEVRSFGVFPSYFLGLVSPDGTWESYDGELRLIDSQGATVAVIQQDAYAESLGEATETWSYLKSPYYLPAGYPDGIYRVGPLARLNIASRMGTPLADQEHAQFRSLAVGAVNGSFHYHYARLIEILASLEQIEALLQDPELDSEDCRAEAGVNRLEGVGVSEAPRGTLFHHYRVDRDGVIQWVNLLIATGQNNLAMQRTIGQIARAYVNDGAFAEGALNRIEAGIRAYDPCLSCSTHALGQMPMLVELRAADGRLLDSLRRD
ncbi:MAG TPA: Ni/Fe hydrogenase subunit alpha [Chloroflexota bacterium]|jgi:NAD-reducing hydrogenase large subunit